LADLGDHVRTWRKLNGLTSALVAERAGISRQTLRDIETGTGTVSTGNLLRVLRVLGILPSVVAATDPLNSDVGRLRADQALPQRVRPRRPTS
jgi:transcriptional regulator with XRE-family HTH domain